MCSAMGSLVQIRLLAHLHHGPMHSLVCLPHNLFSEQVESYGRVLGHQRCPCRSCQLAAGGCDVRGASLFNASWIEIVPACTLCKGDGDFQGTPHDAACFPQCHADYVLGMLHASCASDLLLHPCRGVCAPCQCEVGREGRLWRLPALRTRLLDSHACQPHLCATNPCWRQLGQAQCSNHRRGTRRGHHLDFCFVGDQLGNAQSHSHRHRECCERGTQE
mmetsp:Transcript_13962/g.31655  ORF Transcript_13962/g.31655 Transcript_13962/m.31655 type:complete len:219 (-) Transcript_13962:206-862(-)